MEKDTYFQDRILEEIIDNSLIPPETALWRKVLIQAFSDLKSEANKKYSDRLNKERAMVWFMSESEDFYSVCALANVNPEIVQEKAREIIKHIKLEKKRKRRGIFRCYL